MKNIIRTATITVALATSITIAGAQAQTQTQTQTQTRQAQFLAAQNTSAKEYILSQFADHDLVIVCERDHKELTQYELLRDVISDPRFIERVNRLHRGWGC